MESILEKLKYNFFLKQDTYPRTVCVYKDGFLVLTKEMKKIILLMATPLSIGIGMLLLPKSNQPNDNAPVNHVELVLTPPPMDGVVVTMPKDTIHQF